MKKNLPFFIFFIITTVIVILLFNSRRAQPVLKKAQKCEATGDIVKAGSLYGEAVYTLAPATSLPDINRSRFLSPDLLKKEVEKYLVAIASRQNDLQGDFPAAVAGLLRCSLQNSSPVTSTPPKVTPFTEETFYKEWNATFFAPKTTVDPSHKSLASGNYLRNLSLLILSCGKSYSYEYILLNTATLQATRGVLPAENRSRLYAYPGEYLLITRSTVTFPDSKLWRSDFTAIPLTMPDKASKISMALRTSIIRK